MNPIRLLTFSTPIVSIESRKLTICDEYRAVTDFHAQSCASGQQRELTPTRIKTADIKNDTSDIKIDTSEIIDYLRRLELDKRLGPEKPENYIGADEAGNQRSDPRMQKINFALTRFLETASTTVDSLVQSPWASPTIAAQISAYEDEDEDEDNINLVHAPALARENTEAEIHDILTKESAAFLNDDGQSALHLAATLDEYMTGDVLRHGVDIDIDIRNLDGETPLMCAVRTDKKEIVPLLLKNNANVNVRASESGHTCLHLAAEKDKTGIITRLLLKRGADLEATDEIGLTSLSAAAFHGNDVVARILLEQGADPQASEALHYATMRGNHAFMARLLNPGGPDFEAFYEASSYGFSTQPGRDTVAKRRVFLVRMLLDHGADVHARNSKGFTPLQIAAAAAQGPLVEILLEQGATAEGVTVICAYWGLSASIVKLLIEKGANIHATDSRWNKPALTWEAEVGSPATMEVLLQHGADVHHHDKHCSALLYASGNARVEAVQLLLNAGADSNQLSHENKTSLLGLASGSDRYFLAGRWWEPSAADRKATAILLLDAENGCDPDAKDVYGRAAIHYAASNGWLGVVEVIVDRGGGDWEIPDDKGLTPLERAQQWGHLDVVRFLKRKKLMREEARDEQPGCVAGASEEVSET